MMKKQIFSKRQLLFISLLVVVLFSALAWIAHKNGYLSADSSQEVFAKLERDSQRRQDLLFLKNSIDAYYTAKGEFPSADGWIAENDINKGVPANGYFEYLSGETYDDCVKKHPTETQRCPSNDSLAETLLPDKFIAEIPLDIRAKTNTGGYLSYMYYRDDWCGGDKATYGLYAWLESPTASDTASMQIGKCSETGFDPKDNSMNYRLSGDSQEIDAENASASIPSIAYPHNPENIISLNGKVALHYPFKDLPSDFTAINKLNLRKGWNSFALPFMSKLKNTSAGAFAGLPKYNNKSHIYSWGTNWQILNEKSNHNLGEGYIIYSPNDQTVSLDNFESIIFYDDTTPIEIPLNFSQATAGKWTLVGNPLFKNSKVSDWKVEYNGNKIKFENASPWVDIKYNGSFGVPVLEGGTKYIITDTVKPNQAFWIASKLPGVKLIIQ
mgnify:FL=1